MTLPTRAHGRQPNGYVWRENVGWIDVETSEPFCTSKHKERTLQTRRVYEKKRYWDPKTKVRTRRQVRWARESGRAPKPAQLTLDKLRTTAEATWTDGASDARPEAHQGADGGVQAPEDGVRTLINCSTDS